MSVVRLICFICVWTYFSECGGITSETEKNLIGEEERRGLTLKDTRVNDQNIAESTKRGLYLISQHHHPSDYESSGLGAGYHGSSGPGSYGYVDSGAYGISGSGYNHGASGGGAYYKGPSFGQGYGYSGRPNYGHEGGIPYGHHNEYGGHAVSHGGHGDYSKLALKKLLIPLAGLAILGAAAALSTNPVLLQLGSLQSGKRRRRSVASEIGSWNIYPPNPWARPDRKSRT